MVDDGDAVAELVGVPSSLICRTSSHIARKGEKKEDSRIICSFSFSSPRKEKEGEGGKREERGKREMRMELIEDF